MWAVIEAPAQGWTSAPVLGAGALAAVALAAFVVRQRRARRAAARRRACSANPRFTAASATITVLFFALFGFLFLATQYLQFVLGYSPSAAGVRVLPYAGAMIVFAPLSSTLVARFGTKRVVDRRDAAVRGRARRRRDDHRRARGYGRLAIAFSSWAPAWGSRARRRPSRSWASLPPERANIGSAVNDTTRELGGALGVAIVGSLMSSLYDAPARSVRAARRRARRSWTRCRVRRSSSPSSRRSAP